jgi:probable rRNA maturation factor
MILNRQRRVRVALRPLERFLRRVEKELGAENAGVTVCLVSDAEIARMNETFRKKSGPTDVLSFPAGEQWRVPSGERRARKKEGHTKATRARELARGRRGRGATPRARRSELGVIDSYLGDIAIAPETARRYAKKKGRSLDSELRVLILHGVLHLLGYDHETDHGEMDCFEQKLRRRFGLV